MTRRQVRRMVRHESVITALIGAALGVGVGLALAGLVTSAFSDQGLAFSVPVGSLIAFAHRGRPGGDRGRDPAGPAGGAAGPAGRRWRTSRAPGGGRTIGRREAIGALWAGKVFIDTHPRTRKVPNALRVGRCWPGE